MRLRRRFRRRRHRASSTIGRFPPVSPWSSSGSCRGPWDGSSGRGVPGRAHTVALMIMVTLYASTIITPHPSRFSELVKGSPTLSAHYSPYILLGGIWSGQFTPTRRPTFAWRMPLCGVSSTGNPPEGSGQIFIDTARETAHRHHHLRRQLSSLAAPAHRSDHQVNRRIRR